jgi:hypothetical protein
VPEPPRYPGVPRWAKVQGLLLLTFLLIMLAMVAPMLLGLNVGGHGPGMHGPGGLAPQAHAP